MHRKILAPTPGMDRICWRRYSLWATIVISALSVLLLCGYQAQAWWAKKMAESWVDLGPSVGALRVPNHNSALARSILREHWIDSNVLGFVISEWGNAPWFGLLVDRRVWIPKRTYYEYAKLVTGLEFADDCELWKRWAKAHPDLVWYEQEHRLIEMKRWGLIRSFQIARESSPGLEPARKRAPEVNADGV